MVLLQGPLGGLNVKKLVQGLDPDTQTYFAAMDAAGEPYWPSEVALIDNFVKALKTAGLWSRLTLLWMPVGKSLSGAMRALKHPLGGGTVQINSGFAEDRWDRLVGLDGRNVTHSIDTLTSEFDYVPSNDTHMLLDIVESAPISNHRDMGSLNVDRFQLISSFGGTGYYFSFVYGRGIEGVSSALYPVGVYAASIKDSVSYFWANENILKTTTRPTSEIAPVLGNIHIFKANSESASKIISCASIGKGFTNEEYQAYYAIIQSAREARSSLVGTVLWSIEALQPIFWGDTSQPSTLSTNGIGEITEWRSRYGTETIEPMAGSAPAYKGSAENQTTSRMGIPSVVGGPDRKLCMNLSVTTQIEVCYFAAVYIAHQLQGQLFDARLTTNEQPLIDAGDGGGRSLRTRADAGGLKTISSSALAANTWAIGVWVVNGAGESVFYQDGVAVGSINNVSGLSANRIGILGNGFESNTLSMPGAIASFVFGIGPLTTANRRKLEGALAYQWNLASRLAEDHPYNPSPPYV